MNARGKFTQVIQALLEAPKARRQAGSRDWKYSSGWKKVRSVRALAVRNASSRAKRPRVESRWRVEGAVGVVALADSLTGGIERSGKATGSSTSRLSDGDWQARRGSSRESGLDRLRLGAHEHMRAAPASLG
jgi:hypothetical protein